MNILRNALGMLGILWKLVGKTFRTEKVRKIQHPILPQKEKKPDLLGAYCIDSLAEQNFYLFVPIFNPGYL